MATTTEKRCACIWYDANTPSDGRTCIELRVYGRSPVLRRGEGEPGTENEFREVDMEPDEQCECLCHDNEDDDDDS